MGNMGDEHVIRTRREAKKSLITEQDLRFYFEIVIIAGKKRNASYSIISSKYPLKRLKYVAYAMKPMVRNRIVLYERNKVSTCVMNFFFLSAIRYAINQTQM